LTIFGPLPYSIYRLVNSIIVALKKELHRLVALVLYRSGEIVLNGLPLNHGSEAYFLDIAGDDSRNGFDVLSFGV
jgi:hypothetical protein